MAAAKKTLTAAENILAAAESSKASARNIMSAAENVLTAAEKILAEVQAMLAAAEKVMAAAEKANGNEAISALAPNLTPQAALGLTAEHPLTANSAAGPDEFGIGIHQLPAGPQAASGGGEGQRATEEPVTTPGPNSAARFYQRID